MVETPNPLGLCSEADDIIQSDSCFLQTFIEIQDMDTTVHLKCEHNCDIKFPQQFIDVKAVDEDNCFGFSHTECMSSEGSYVSKIPPERKRPNLDSTTPIAVSNVSAPSISKVLKVKGALTGKKSKECYYDRSIIVQCPACDTSYKGGRTALKCLMNHVTLEHSKESSKLRRVIRKHYCFKGKCDCFGCTTSS